MYHLYFMTTSSVTPFVFDHSSHETTESAVSALKQYFKKNITWWHNDEDEQRFIDIVLDRRVLYMGGLYQHLPHYIQLRLEV